MHSGPESSSGFRRGPLIISDQFSPGQAPEFIAEEEEKALRRPLVWRPDIPAMDVVSLEAAVSKIKYLSSEYLAELEKRGSRMPEKAGTDVDIQHLIREAPDGGEIHYYFKIRSGQLVEARLGMLEDPTCTLKLSYESSVKMTKGELKPLSGLVTGKIRPGGDVAKLRSSAPTLSTPEFKAISDEVHELTDY
uniref:Putative sterol carrier protein n=1 Tax=Streptomyces sp. CNH287 TaxID=1288082 RepID=U6A1Z3_9ACTN|nr:putative sterol carrier protein [Streptomyces sp. CNH287]